MKTALAHGLSTVGEALTSYAPSLKIESHVAAQQVPGTRSVSKPFSVVTPESLAHQLELPNRVDQGPPRATSHEPQADTDADQLRLDVGQARPSAKIRTLQPFKFPALPAPIVSFNTLRVCEGVVSHIEGPMFKAVLTDVHSLRFGKEAGEFYLTEVSEEDKPLVQLGAVFYWYVGVEVMRSRLREVSEIRFRRLPGWSVRQVKSVKNEAERLERLFGQKGRSASSTET